MKLYGVTDFACPCQAQCLGLSFEGLKRYVPNLQVNVKDKTEWAARRVDKDSDACWVMFEPGMVGESSITVKEIRSWYPNAKLIAFATDTPWVKAHGVQHQIDRPQDVDLWLEHTSLTRDWMAGQGVNVDFWFISISDLLIEKLEALPKLEKDIDFIGLYHGICFDDPKNYRRRMRDYILQNNMTFTQGGGGQHQDNEKLDELWQNYRRSWFTLETTQGNDVSQGRFLKGFRWALGPFCDSCIIIDKGPDTDLIPFLPTYEYENFSQLVDLARELKHDVIRRQLILEGQRRWCRENSLERQILRLLKKHKLYEGETISG